MIEKTCEIFVYGELVKILNAQQAIIDGENTIPQDHLSQKIREFKTNIADSLINNYPDLKEFKENRFTSSRNKQVSRKYKL